MINCWIIMFYMLYIVNFCLLIESWIRCCKFGVFDDVRCLFDGGIVWWGGMVGGVGFVLGWGWGFGDKVYCIFGVYVVLRYCLGINLMNDC